MALAWDIDNLHQIIPMHRTSGGGGRVFLWKDEWMRVLVSGHAHADPPLPRPGNGGILITLRKPANSSILRNYPQHHRDWHYIVHF